MEEAQPFEPRASDAKSNKARILQQHTSQAAAKMSNNNLVFRFMDLPLELRSMIYEFALEDHTFDHPTIWPICKFHWRRIDFLPPILNVDTLIRAEAFRAFLQNVQVQLQYEWFDEQCMRDIQDYMKVCGLTSDIKSFFQAGRVKVVREKDFTLSYGLNHLGDFPNLQNVVLEVYTRPEYSYVGCSCEACVDAGFNDDRLDVELDDTIDTHLLGLAQKKKVVASLQPNIADMYGSFTESNNRAWVDKLKVELGKAGFVGCFVVEDPCGEEFARLLSSLGGEETA